MNDSKLIDLVEAQPSIYDKTDIFYSNKEYVRSIWQMIASEMQQEVPVCQKRWRYLRDYFVRQLHIAEDSDEKKIATTPTSSNSKRSYWPFYERLSFLRPFSSTRRRLKRSPTDELGETTNTYDDVNSIQYACSEGSDDQTRVSSSPTVSGNQLPIEGNISNLDYLKFYQAMQMAAHQSFSDSSSNVNENGGVGGFGNLLPVENYIASKSKRKIRKVDAIDEHDCFFKSILSSVRQISDEHIIAFRTEVLQALMKFRSLSEATTDNEGSDTETKEEETNSDDDVVVVNTEEAHWRTNLFRRGQY